MNLEVITKNVDFDAYRNFYLSRRKIKKVTHLLNYWKLNKKVYEFKGCASFRKLRRHDISVQ